MTTVHSNIENEQEVFYISLPEISKVVRLSPSGAEAVSEVPKEAQENIINAAAGILDNLRGVDLGVSSGDVLYQLCSDLSQQA